MKPTVKIGKRDTKKAIATKVKRMLKRHGMYKELTLFKDFSPFTGQGKEGRLDMIDLAMHYVNVEKTVGSKLSVPVKRR